MSSLPFKPVSLTYKGEDFEVPERVWGLIGTIENVISRNKLVIALHNRDIPITKVAEAFAAALNYAGAKNVQPFDVSIGAGQDQIYLHGLALFEILISACNQKALRKAGQPSGEIKPVKPAKKKGHAKRPIKSGADGA